MKNVFANKTRAVLAAVAASSAVLAQTQNPCLSQFASDEQSGISSNKLYTHAIKIGQGTSPTPIMVKGVSFLKASYEGTRTSPDDGRVYGWNDFPQNGWNNDNPDCIVTPDDQEVYKLLEDFRHGGGNRPTLSGLTPGFPYEFSFYWRSYEKTGANYYRRQIIYFDTDGANDSLLVSNTLYNATGDTRLGYRYTASAQGTFKTYVDRSPFDPYDTANFCLWFFTNELLNHFVLPEPTDITTSGATLHARFAHNVVGAPGPDITAFWAFEDCGTDTNAWRSADGHGSTATTPVSTPTTVSGADVWVASAEAGSLLPSTNYVYRFMAVTAAGKTLWSEPGTFATRDLLPECDMLAFTQAGKSNAIATVRLAWNGSADPLETADLLVCWGDVDGAASVDDWLLWNPGFPPVLTNSCVMGNHVIPLAATDAFVPNREYFCRAFAINAAGTNAAPATLSFLGSGVFTWTAQGDPDTAWTNAANWDIGVPLGAATANFHLPGATVTAGDRDLSVARALVNAQGEVVFDLGANTLFASDGFYVGGAPVPDFPAEGGSVMRLAGGTIDVGVSRDFVIGDGDANPGPSGSGNALVMEGASTVKARDMIVGRAPASAANRGWGNSLSVLGPDARLQVANLRVGTPYGSLGNTFLLRDGEMTLTRIYVGERDSHANTAVISNSTVTVNGVFDGSLRSVYIARESAGSGQSFHLLNSTLNLLEGGIIVGESWGGNSHRVVFSNSTINGSARSGLQFDGQNNCRIDIYQDPGADGGNYVFAGMGWRANSPSGGHRLTLNNASLTFTGGAAPNTRQENEFAGENNTLVGNNGKLAFRKVNFSFLAWAGS
ncbi:MAG: hypothetical protein FWF96_02985, partial [Kiritimatiellaeota bacterium]|nr:hypothetical protein [Kiritimatiellota bacterium]